MRKTSPERMAKEIAKMVQDNLDEPRRIEMNVNSVVDKVFSKEHSVFGTVQWPTSYKLTVHANDDDQASGWFKGNEKQLQSFYEWLKEEN